MRTHGEPCTPEFASEVRRLSKLGLTSRQCAGVLNTTENRVDWCRRKYNIASPEAERIKRRNEGMDHGRHHGPRVPEAPYSVAGPAIGETGPRYLEPEGYDMPGRFEDDPRAPVREAFWRPIMGDLP